MRQAYTAKIIIAVNYFRKTVHRRRLTGFWMCLRFWIYQYFGYTGVLNILGLWICQGYNMLLVLNMSGFWIYHSSKYARVTQGFEYPKYAWTILGYAWLCLNVPISVWMAFVLYLPIVIPYLKTLLFSWKVKIWFFFYSIWKYLILFVVLE